ncbi:MAG: peptidoglycan DD-metalloendopeptidase family protein [Clostridia bacterium]|nr:peptidoglycan DD-metalloendopeptidase family protein [Clostridia bacterium]
MAPSNDSRYLTILLLPDGAGRSRSVRIPAWLPKSLLFVALSGLFALVQFSHDYRAMARNVEELHRLQEVNAQQARDLEETRAQIAALQDELAKIQELDRTLRSELHIEGSPQSSAYGSPSAVTALAGGATAQGAPSSALPTSIVQATGALTELRAANAQIAASAQSVTGRSAAGLSSAALRQDAEALVQQAMAELASLTEIQAATTQYIRAAAHYPDQWPLAGAVTSTFGYRRSPLGWGREFHEGIDIAAPYGTPIRAAAAGVVVHAGWLTGFGRAVKIDHGNGLVTLYGHQSRIKVTVGQTVKKGQIIGYVGSSGLSTGPHLHFGVYKRGTPVDPMPYVTSDLYQYLKK